MSSESTKPNLHTLENSEYIKQESRIDSVTQHEKANGAVHHLEVLAEAHQLLQWFHNFTLFGGRGGNNGWVGTLYTYDDNEIPYEVFDKVLN